MSTEEGPEHLGAIQFILVLQAIKEGVDQFSVSNGPGVMQLVGHISKGDVVFRVCEGG
jgi:hypothetical protein